MARRCGLTPAEARVAGALAAGLDTDEIACALGVQPNTMLAHLKQALAKTGSLRRTQLVAPMWRRVLERCAASPAPAVAADTPLPSTPPPTGLQ